MNGVLVVNKPEGLSSHQVISKIKKILKVKKIGHAGTLDPLATGVLVVLINDATKLSDYLMADEKTYLARIAIGSATDTEDRLGKLSELKIVKRLENVEQVLNSIIGPLEQIPPMYSAIKQDGKKLYELARKGEEVTRKSREVFISSLKRVSKIEYLNNHAYFNFEATVSKGTYIRTLCVEIGERLGYPAHMDSLSRISSGNFNLENSYTLEDIESNQFILVPLLEAMNHYKIISLDDSLLFKVRNGQKLSSKDFHDTAERVIFEYNNQLVAIYKKEENMYKAERVWN